MKNGQANIAVLIALIGLFIVAYVLFLPPEEREKLLNQTSEGESLDGSTLLLESPGLISETEKGKLEHELNDINLFVKTEPLVIDLARTLSVSKSLFGGTTQELSFNVEDLTDLDKTVLSFSVFNPKGELIVELNGQKVYQNKVKINTIEVVSLPIDLLKKVNNLRIFVSGPGIAFWSENHYTLKDIKVIEYFERENSIEERTFVMSSNELDNAEDVKLEYNIYCNSLDNGASVFKVYLNNELKTAENLNCVTDNRNLEIDPEDLDEGQNSLRFVVDRGDFLISNIKIVTKIEGLGFWFERFDINSDDFERITDGDFKVILKMSFETNKKKEGKIEVNEETFTLDTTSDTFSKDISDFVEKGENFIRIIPTNDFVVNSLRISLQER